MTLLLPNSAFLHVPKTGGTWIRHIITETGVPYKEINKVPNPELSPENYIKSWHNTPTHDEEFLNKENKFCFVRNPLEWHRSYWAFKTLVTRARWNLRSEFDVEFCGYPTFPAYIDRILEASNKSYVDWLYTFFTDHCNMVGKQENLADNLKYILGEIEGDWRKKINYSAKRKQASDIKQKKGVLYAPGQIPAMIELEHDAFLRFDYSTNPDDYKHLQNDSGQPYAKERISPWPNVKLENIEARGRRGAVVPWPY